MPVFISYSHADKNFVDKFAANLIVARVSVWLDRWELNVGDSLIEKIQDGLKDASALIVILSSASVQSQWCRKELSVGLWRELEERRVVVLPILIEDCDIPLFLCDKKYADFRSDYDEGWHAVMEAIAGVTSLAQGRITGDEYHTDWSEDTLFINGSTVLFYTLVQSSQHWPYSIVSEISVVLSPASTLKFQQYVDADLDWWGKLAILQSIFENTEECEMRVLLEDSSPKLQRLTLQDDKNGFGYKIVISARRLGHDTGKDIIIDCADHLRKIRDQAHGRMRQPTKEELNALTEIAFCIPKKERPKKRTSTPDKRRP